MSVDSSYIYNPLYEAAWYLVPFVIAIYVLKSSWFAKIIGEKHSDSLKKLKISVYLILFASLAYFAFVDEELNPEIVLLLENHSKNISKHNNGSVYQLGMWSSFDSEPYELGLWRIKQYESAYSNTEFPANSIDYEDYPRDKWIEELFVESDMPKWLCDFDETDCLDLIYSNSEGAIYLASEFNKHISRYDGILNYSHFGLSHEPSVFLL